MFDVYLFIDLIIIGSLLILAAAVITQRFKSEINLTFAATAVSVAIWIIANYISNDLNNSPSVALTANYFVFFFSYATALNLLHFTISLTRDIAARKIFKWFYLPALFVGALSFTHLIPAGVKKQGEVYAVEFGSALPAYFVFIIAMIVAIFIVLTRGKKRLLAADRARIRAIQKSFAYSLPALALMLFIIPVATGQFGLTNIGILPMAALVGGMYYAVFKHKLFNLRVLVVRSLAYAFTLGLILVVYALISTEISKNFFKEARYETWRNAFDILLIIIAMVTYGPIKSYFDKVTNKYFYRDAYDPQQFIDELNKIAVTNVDVDPLLNQSAEVVDRYLKTTFCSVVLRPTAYNEQRNLGDTAHLMKEDIAALRELTAPIKELVIVADDLQQSDPKLYRLLNKHNIGIVSKMTSSVDYNLEGIGIMLFGIKKSGNTFSTQDKRVISIISSELTIATQNALRFEEIENFSATLQGKVDDATKRLKRANEKLQTLDETKDEFISMASHQLRTPLTSVKGYVSMVLEGDAGPLNDMQRKLLEQSFISSQRMVFLIADLLNLSRLKTGRFVIENVACNLAEVIEGEVMQLKETAAGKNLTLTYKAPKKFPTLMLDETKIRQVIMNFVDNAIYYTPSGGKIEITLVEAEKTIEFTVKDNGIGVPDAEQHHLFNKFYRAKNAQKARPDGTGLGLFMAKKVIIAQGGALIFSSSVGKGSTFGFSFAKSKLALSEIKTAQ
jgi:signal transduction histidine kinase